MKTNLDSLYEQAQHALASRDYDRASDLLKEILVADESYRDASRLLADLVARQRRLWYKDLRFWGATCVLILLGLLFAAKDNLAGLMAKVQPTGTPTATETSEVAEVPGVPATPTSPPLTAIPLGWKRLYPGTVFSRSTVSVMVADPKDPSVLYLGTSGAGIYKSINAGVSWAPSHMGIGHASIDSLVIDPADPDTLYAGTSFGAIYRSQDGSALWGEINEGINLPGGFAPWSSVVVMDSRQPTHLLAVVAGNLYETQNSGEWWDMFPVKVPDCPINLVVHPLESRTLFVTTCEREGGVYKSEDGGLTWSRYEVVSDFMSHNYDFLEIDQGTGTTLYTSGEIVVEEPPFGVVTFVSLDRGETWARIGLDDSCTALAIHPEDARSAVCAAKYGGLPQRTYNGGQTWQNLAKPPAGEIHRLLFDARDPGTLWAGGQGLYVSRDDGASWTARNDGLGSARLELYLYPSDPSNLYVDDFYAGRLFRSLDGGQTWDLIADEGKGLAFDADGRTLYRLGEGGILISQDQGETWTRIETPFPPPENLDAHPSREGTLFVYPVMPSAIAISSDGGASWEWAAGIEGLKNAHLFFDHELGHVAYSIDEGGGGLYRSEDDGRNWVQCGSPDAKYSDTHTRLAIDSQDNQRLFLATWGRGILTSEDGCRSWTSRNQGLESQIVNSVAIDPKSSSTIYAGTDGGVYLSFDDGNHWGKVNEGLLGALVIYSRVVDAQGNVYAATPYGIFKLEAK